MASHFRSSERQGSEELEAKLPVIPDLSEDQTADKAAPEIASASQSVVEPAPMPQQDEASVPSVEAQVPVMAAPAFVEAPAREEAPEMEAVNPTSTQVSFAEAFSGEEDVPPVKRDGTPTISLRNVTLIYPSQPNKPALDDVSLDIYPGEFVFLVGHSGSGKSTFIRLHTRELRASKGQVLVATFLGKQMQYLVETKEGNYLVNTAAETLHAPHDPVTIVFPPDKTIYTVDEG